MCKDTSGLKDSQDLTINKVIIIKLRAMPCIRYGWLIVWFLRFVFYFIFISFIYTMAKCKNVEIIKIFISL